MAPNSTVTTTVKNVEASLQNTPKSQQEPFLNLEAPQHKSYDTHLTDKKSDCLKKLQKEKYKCFLGKFETPLIWTNIIGLVVIHYFAVYYFVTHDFIGGYKIVLWEMLIGGIGGFGITAGAHRLWTHRSYKAKLPLKIILLICYSVSGQNDLFEWVRDHRVHHRYSETDADPHNSNRGFFFAHVGWLCMKKHPEVLRKGKSVDMSDIKEDPLLAFHIRYWNWFRLVFCFVLPSIIPHYWWGETWEISICANVFVRWVANLNFTWLVNSAAHMWGYKPYDRNINPVENKWVSIVAMGEGWHNYHHTFPWDYRAAEMGKLLNVTTMWLNFFAKIGWAYGLKEPSQDLVRRTIEKRGDGTHTISKRGQHCGSVEECPDPYDSFNNTPTKDSARSSIDKRGDGTSKEGQQCGIVEESSDHYGNFKGTHVISKGDQQCETVGAYPDPFDSFNNKRSKNLVRNTMEKREESKKGKKSETVEKCSDSYDSSNDTPSNDLVRRIIKKKGDGTAVICQLYQECGAIRT